MESSSAEARQSRTRAGGASLASRQDTVAEIRNPNQAGTGGGGTDNRSFLVIMIVMVGVFAGLQYFRSRKTQPLAPPAAITQTQAGSSAAQAGGVPATAAAVNTPAAAANAPAAQASTPAVVAATESSVTVENELYRIVFSNRGGEVRSWILKRQKDRNGHPLDLVHDAAARQFGYPLSLYTYDPALTAQLRSTLYVASASGQITAPGSIEFHYAQNGLEVTKQFRFDESYVVHATTQVTRNGVPVRSLLSWPGGFGDQDQVLDYNGASISTMRGDKAEHTAYNKVVGGDTLPAVQFAAVTDPYFAAAFLPDDTQNSTAVTLHQTIDAEKLRRNGTPSGKSQQVPVLGIAVGDISGLTQTRVFAGPKSVELLKKIHVSGSSESLEPLVNFGFWGPIAKLLFLLLTFIQSHVASNWGWAIVVMTIVLNIIILPFRYQTMKSGLKMQRIQPQMDAIKAKYAKYKVTDPKRADMNGEIMALQKANGVNMFGGCVPTLLTFPLLFAMLGMLPKVVELRQAHWLWLHDLTTADPFHILPIVMVVSQFLVQFYMPSPGVDPQQQRMMAFMMPVFSGYITWNYSAGLALYWCVGNLIMIGAQFAMNNTPEGREMRALAAKRARRKLAAPAGKTIQGKVARR